MRKLGFAMAGLLAGVAPIAAAAQTAPAPSPPNDQAAAEPESQGDDIVVTGEVRGAVVGDIQPEIQLSPADVKAYGVSSLAELLEAIAPQTRSGRGRGGDAPVVLLNGRRISSFQEIATLPPEAVERVDILPEEVALKYGYRADQRVVNFVLRPRFRSIATELGGSVPTAGGNASARGEVNVVRIRDRGRVNVDMQVNSTSALLESERGIVSGTPQAIDQTPYRTLVGASQQATLNAVYSRPLSAKTQASFNAKLDVAHRESLLGLPALLLDVPGGNPFSTTGQDATVARYLDSQGPLGRDTNTRSAHLGATLNGDLKAEWRWSVTGNYDLANSSSVTDTGLDPARIQPLLDANSPSLDPFGPIPLDLIVFRPADTTRTVSSNGSVDALVNGPLFKLPAGDVSTSLRVSGRTSDYSSDSVRGGLARSSDIARDSGSGQINIDLPIASRRRAVLEPIGDLSLNANLEVEHFSDFGTLVTTGYGAVWSPIKQVRLIASVTDEENAPSAQQLGDPLIATPNVRIFDYVRGRTVDITAISGGNPGLSAESRHALKLGLNARPFADKDLNFSVDYNRSTTRGQIASFPVATAEIEAAFPGRFVRDGAGELVSVDTRPVNFDRAERAELRWGFNFSMPLGSTIEKRFQERRAQREAERDKARAEAERTGQPLPPEGPPRERGEWRGRPGGGDGQRGPGGPGGPGGFRGFGGGGFGGRGSGLGRGALGGPNGLLAGRIQFSLYHTWHLKEQVTIRPGLPVLDLLGGSATGSRGGQPEHEVEAQFGVSKDGLGARLIGKWQSGTQVNGGTLGNPQTLDFSSLGTLNLRLFADMGQQIRLVRKHRWLIGTRISLGVDNIFDSRQRVTDANGVVPLSYQPNLLDPTGRTVRLTIRKLFF